MITRRTILTGTGAVALGSILPAIVRAHGAQPIMIFISAWDCGPCQHWLRETWPGFRETVEFRRLDWYKIDSPRIRSAYEDEYWQAPKRADGKPGGRDLRHYRDLSKLKSGTPRWLLVKNEKLLLNAGARPARGRTGIPRSCLPSVPP